MRRFRIAIAVAATGLLLGPLVWFWQSSLLPDAYSTMDMGEVDTGGAGGDHHMHHTAGRSVTSLIADPARPADVMVTMTARKQRFRLASGRDVDGYTLNGQSPGPTIRATAGQLVQVSLVNESVPDGVTLHWHGLDVPNAMDGVAGVTQDAVGVGAEFAYRFVADQVGTFWYHSHQISHVQVRSGLFGALVITPASPVSEVDVVALTHVYHGVRTINGHEGDVPVQAAPGELARVRIINSDNGPMSAWVAGASFRLVAVDGTDLNGPSPVENTAVLVTAGGRADVEVRMPADGSPVRVHIGGPTGIVLGSRSHQAPTAPRPAATLDLLSYGTPAPLGFDPNRRPTGSSGTTSGGGPGSSTADRVYFGRSTAASTPTCRCSWSPTATWYG